MKTEITGSLKEILQEMCKRVGADYEMIDFNKPEWYLENTWTEKEQEDFKQWMFNYFLQDKKRLVGLMSYPKPFNKKRVEKFIDTFIMNYGWKCKYD